MMIKPEEIKVPEELEGLTNILSQVFSYQYKFMKVLESKNKIPPISEFNLGNKGSQSFMKQNISALIEEIFEMHEIHETLSNLSPEEYQLAVKEGTRDFNVEQADCLHFWVEIFILMDITPQDMKTYFMQLGEHKGIPFNQNDDALVMSFQYTEYLMNSDKEIPLHTLKRTSFRMGIDRLSWPDKDMFSGGTLVGPDLMMFSEKFLFKVVYYLNLASALLKGKYWRSEEVPANSEKVKEYLYESWIWYNMYLNIHTFQIGDIVKTYYRKNQINIIRQEKGW